jgi:hypothetical protein
MHKPNFKKIMLSPYVVASVITGVILLALTLRYNVNPVAACAVDGTINETFIGILFFTTMPAWIAGMVCGLGTILSLPFMFLFQIIIFIFLGLLLRLIHNAITRLIRR